MNSGIEELALRVPETREAILKIQETRKPVAFENARRSNFWKDKLAHIDPEKLDDPLAHRLEGEGEHRDVFGLFKHVPVLVV